MADGWHQQQPGGKDTLLDQFLRLHQLNSNVCRVDRVLQEQIRTKLSETVQPHQCPEATVLFNTILVEYLWKVCSLLPGKIGSTASRKTLFDMLPS